MIDDTSILYSALIGYWKQWSSSRHHISGFLVCPFADARQLAPGDSFAKAATVTRSMGSRSKVLRGDAASTAQAKQPSLLSQRSRCINFTTLQLKTVDKPPSAMVPVWYAVPPHPCIRPQFF